MDSISKSKNPYKYSKKSKGQWKSRMTKIYRNKKVGTSQIMKFKGGLPDRAHVELEYREQFNDISVSGNNYKLITYVINWPYDPYDGVGNISAFYFGFWAAAYSFYHVNFFTCIVDLLCTNTAAAPVSGTICWGFFRYGDNIPDTVNGFLSYPNTNGVKFTGGYGTTNRTLIKDKMSVWKALGRKYDPSLDNTAAAATPIERVSLSIAIFNESGNVATFAMDPLFKYYCTFNKFKLLTGASDYNYDDPAVNPVAPADMLP